MKTPLRNRVGARVKALRLLTGLSQEALADRCGFARSYMSRIERGTANLSLDALERLSEALCASERDFFLFPEHDSPALLVVPYAADGSCFHPGLASSRDGSFKVGEKNAPMRFRSFEEALAYLAKMPVAKWWRPNAVGHRGLVSAVEWRELVTEEPI
ncbi:helix-turn-helix domain-containing protein [Pseudomonas fulva]|uniref:helix-turn-helix domain-containing protein n=1 Tax=Pseudomonas TaxID=286 RepID=UPI003D0626F8